MVHFWYNDYTMNESQANEKKRVHAEVLKQIITLATSGFGFVAALAWNNLIQDFVDSYIKKYLPQGSSLISLLIYAVIVTTVAVIVTMQLSKLLTKLENK